MANPSDRKVNFGALRVGQTNQRNLKLVNRSPAPITFTLAITPAVVALQQANILTINPSTEITLRANGGSCGVELTFKPKTRIPHFTEEVSTLLPFILRCKNPRISHSGSWVVVNFVFPSLESVSCVSVVFRHNVWLLSKLSFIFRQNVWRP